MRSENRCGRFRETVGKHARKPIWSRPGDQCEYHPKNVENGDQNADLETVRKMKIKGPMQGPKWGKSLVDHRNPCPLGKVKFSYQSLVVNGVCMHQ